MRGDNPYDRPMTLTTSSPAVRRWLLLFLLATTGCVVAFLGVIYGGLLVGVPYPDPTAEMARRETFHVAISSWMMTIGVGSFVCGVFALLCVLIVSTVTRARS